jgi:glycosyltransferase involved in cell wall biosynthesis
MPHDMKIGDPSKVLKGKTRVLMPGIDFSVLDAVQGHNKHRAPVILWNHRWEHDKNPEQFFKTLMKFDNKGVDFHLVVLGQSYKDIPPIFEQARKRLGHRILHYGYERSVKEYARLLKSCDIVVSTAGHEFFGMAVIEAVRAGCRPLLPNRLSYPELFPKEFLYEGKDFEKRLKQEISIKRRLSKEQVFALTERFSWDKLVPEYKRWIIEGGKQ